MNKFVFSLILICLLVSLIVGLAVIMTINKGPADDNEIYKVISRLIPDGGAGVERVSIGGEGRPGSLLEPGESLEFSFKVPRDGRLEMFYGLARPLAQENKLFARLRVRIKSEFGSTATLLDSNLRLDESGEDRHWIMMKRELSKFSAQNVTMYFETAPVNRPNDPDAAPPLMAVSLPNLSYPLARGDMKNVILISLDSLRADHLKSYGYERETAPAVERLATEGAVFGSCGAQAPWAIPSYATMLTGRYPSRHLLYHKSLEVTLPEEVLTLAEVLAKAGYKCNAYTEDALVSGKLGFHQGFDNYYELQIPGLPCDDWNDCYWLGAVEDVTGRARAFVKENRDHPFFLFIQSYEAGKPYNPEPPFNEVFDDGYDGPFRERISLKSIAGLRNNRPEPHVLEHIEALYDGEIMKADSYIDGLLSDLKRAGLEDETLVIITSANGEDFFEHGEEITHGERLYDTETHVPLVMKLPGKLAAGLRINEPVGLVDLMPTVLGLTGIKQPPGIQGKDLGRLLDVNAEKPEDRTIFSETNFEGTVVRSARWKNHKYIIEIHTGMEYLFNLEDDPEELNNLAEDERELTERLRDKVRDYIREHEGGYHLQFSTVAEGHIIKGEISADGFISNITGIHLEGDDEISADPKGSGFTFKLTMTEENDLDKIRFKLLPEDAPIKIKLLMDEEPYPLEMFASHAGDYDISDNTIVYNGTGRAVAVDPLDAVRLYAVRGLSALFWQVEPVR